MTMGTTATETAVVIDRNVYAEILRDLDVCRSLFESLDYQLENNAGIRDYHSLAVLASEGVRKIDGLADRFDRGGVTA